MTNILNKSVLSESDLVYFRERHRNRAYQQLMGFIEEKAIQKGITRKEMAAKIKKDPAQVTRWLAGPGNLTLDTISDLLISVGAVMEHSIVPLVSIDKKLETENPVVQTSSASALNTKTFRFESNAN